MAMERSSKKRVLAAVFVLLGLVLFALAALAVPAAPHGVFTGAEAACRSRPGRLVTLDQLPPAQENGPRRIPRPGETTKNIPLLTLVIGFRDVGYRKDYDWAEEIYNAGESLRAYYTDMSFGKFTFDPVPETSAFGKDGNTNRFDARNDGVIHVTVNRNHENWTGVGLTQTGVALRDLAMARVIRDAIEKAGSYMNFARYDADGDGEIGTSELAIALVFAGFEASAIDEEGFVEGVAKYLWAHAWSLSEMIEDYGWNNRQLTEPKPNGVKVSSYIAIAEQMARDQMEPISVLAHELGHYLGLPDLYNTVYDTRGEWGGYDVFNASVMASGSWGVNPNGGYMPYSMDAWSRYVLGWIQPAAAETDGDYDVISQSYQGGRQEFAAVQIETQNDGEYYLLENRQPQKWDAGIAKGYEGSSLTNGIILWHVDMNTFETYTDDNAVNNPDHHPAVMPLYPESGDGKRFTFVGAEKEIYSANPFFDAAYWNRNFSNLGAALDLPIYGRDGTGNSRAARLLSGIRVRFLSDSGHRMKIRLDTKAKIHFHSWKETAVVKAAACTEDGLHDVVCTTCGKSERQTIGALGHDIGANGVCSRCGKAFCPLCKGEHSGFFGSIVGFFHRLIWRMTHLFSR